MSDLGDQAQEGAELDRRLALLAHERRQPAAGVMHTECEDCEGPIEAKRLQVLPYTNRCASCAQDYERRRP